MLEDDLVEDTETVVITLTGVNGGDARTELATGEAATASIDITSEDVAGVAVTPGDLSASESGDLATLGFALTARPTGSVLLTFVGDAQCSVSPTTITFTESAWNVMQTLTVAALADGIAEGGHSCQPTVTVTSSDPLFDALTVTLPQISISDGLIDEVREQLATRLHDDLRDTLGDQSRQLQRIGRGAAARLRAGAEDTSHCGPERGLDPDGSLLVDGGTLAMDATMAESYYSCARDARIILETSVEARYSSGEPGFLRFSGTYQRERRVGDDRLRGWFLGGYLNTPLGRSDTDRIDGFGFAAGIYGATRLTEGLVAEHYAGLGYGRHDFRFSFGTTDPIVAVGSYSYLAGYAGAAISGETILRGHSIVLRSGADLALGVPTDARVTATRGADSETGTVGLSGVAALRLFVEAEIDLDRGGVNSLEHGWALRPGLHCDASIGVLSAQDCGASAALSWTRTLDGGNREVMLELSG